MARTLHIQVAMAGTVLALAWANSHAASPDAIGDGKTLDDVNISSPVPTFLAVMAAVESNDFATADGLMTKLLASSDFQKFDAPKQLQHLMMAVQIASSLKDHPRALKLARQASELSTGEAIPWQARLVMAGLAGDFTDAAFSFTTLLKRWPDSLQSIDERMLTRMCLQILHKADADSAFEMLQSLYAVDWWPVHVAALDQVKYLLARHALDRGNGPLARAVSADVTSVQGLLLMRIDKRFSAIVKGDPKRFNIERAAVNEVAHWRAETERDPRDLEWVRQLASALIVNRRCDESLRVLDHALQRLRENDSARNFSDTSDTNWIMNERSGALSCLGRWNEAERQLLESSHQAEQGMANVSQALNMANFYVRLNKPAEALRMLESFSAAETHAGPYGMAVVERVRHSVAVQTNDVAEKERTFAYLSAHRADAMPLYENALYDEGRMDELASIAIQNLTGPETRGLALAALQSFMSRPSPPYVVYRTEGAHDSREREDVKRVAKQFGTLEHFRIYRPPGF